MIFQQIYKYLFKNINKFNINDYNIINDTEINNNTFGQYIIIDEISNQYISYNNLDIIQNKKDDINICCEIFKFS